MTMRLLFVGDVVGPPALDYLVGRLPGLRRDLGLDLVVVNAENAALSGRELERGFGMSRETIAALFGAGVDVVTSGNHAWDHAEADEVLAHPRMLRPHNLPPGRSGRGLVAVEVGDEAVTVLNLADAAAIPDALPAYPAWRALAPASTGTGTGTGTVIVDFHGGDLEQKFGFAYAADGEVAAVLGTHTHEATLPLYLLPGGTALVADVGMTGPLGGWGGIDAAHAVATVRGEAEPAGAPLASGPITLGAVLLTIEGGRATAITRVL